MQTEEHNHGKPPSGNGRAEPEPLMPQMPEPTVFPLEALPKSLQEAASAIHRAIQAPMEICCHSVLAAVNLASQPHIDVSIDGRTSPISLNLITVAESGERKTSVDKVAIRPIKLYQNELFKTHEIEQQQYRIKSEAHKAKTKAIKTKYKNKPMSELCELLNELGPEPVPPIHPNIIYDDTTVQGVVIALRYGLPSGGIFTSEGGQIVGGFSLSEEQKVYAFSTLSKFWDGESITRTRATMESFLLENRRLCQHILVQPEIINTLLSDETAIGQGYVGRICLSWPKSMMGKRQYVEGDLSNDPAISQYWAKINSIIRLPFPVKESDENQLCPRIVQPDDDAKKISH